MLDNSLFKLLISLIQTGMNSVLAANNYNVLATQNGNVITTEGGNPIGIDQIVIPVIQAYQPTLQGVNTAPCLYIHKIGDRRIGAPRQISKWKTTYSKLAAENQQDIATESGIGIGVDGTQDSSMVHKEYQRYETTFQISALATQDPSTPMQLTASDFVNFAAAIVQSESFIQSIEAQGIGVLKVYDVRNPYFLDDREQFEASPSFDFILAHNQVIVSTTPVITSKTFKLYPV